MEQIAICTLEGQFSTSAAGMAMVRGYLAIVAELWVLVEDGWRRSGIGTAVLTAAEALGVSLGPNGALTWLDCTNG